MHLEGLRDFPFEPLLQAGQLDRCFVGQIARRDLVFGDEAWKNEVEQILRERGHRIFRGEADAAEVLDAATLRVRLQQSLDEIFDGLIHVASSLSEKPLSCKCGCKGGK